MKPQIVKAMCVRGYEDALGEVAGALRDGALVVFPTETVYGVAASAVNTDAMTRLRALKSRTNAQPFTVHPGSDPVLHEPVRRDHERGRTTSERRILEQRGEPGDRPSCGLARRLVRQISL